MSIDKISMERMFPSPLEVDRFLYPEEQLAEWQAMGFRPLSRWIGSYTPDFVVGFKNKHKI